MCFVCLSEQTETFALYNTYRLVSITKVESVYRAVRKKRKNVLHADDIAFMCFVCLSEQTETFALYNTYRLVSITEVESVY